MMKLKEALLLNNFYRIRIYLNVGRAFTFGYQFLIFQAGFEFKFPKLRSALEDALRNN